MMARSFWEELNSSLVEDKARREAERILEDSMSFKRSFKPGALAIMDDVISDKG